jgi:hypothetical protein
MSFGTYEDVRQWARSIKEGVVRRNMPPWHIDAAFGIQACSNDRSLTADQIAIVVK